MKSDVGNTIRLHSVDRTEAPRHRSEYGCRLVALSGTADVQGIMHRAELLSPLLSGQRPGETLALQIGYAADRGTLDIGLAGTALGASDAEADRRRDTQSAILHALVRAQFPGFVIRARTQPSTSQAPAVTIVLRPMGRRIAPRRAQSREPGPQLVNMNTDNVLLPAMGLSAERLAAAVELLKARGESATLSLALRMVRFDAAALRLLREARETAIGNEPRSSVEAVRRIAETFSDDALMTALLDEASGIEVTLSISSATPLDEASRRMLCHAVFGVEPVETDTAAALDLSSIYPRTFALSRAVGGLAAAGLIALKRVPALYEPPSAGGVVLGHTSDGRPVVITESDRALHTFAIGATGTGKSTLVLNQIVADMETGKGLVLLEPHGDLWEAARHLVPPHRQGDVVLAHLGDPAHAFTMNVLAGLGGDPAIERNATVNGLIRLFKNSLWPGVPEAFGPMFELYFRHALLLLMEAGGETATILDFERIFQDAGFRRELIERCDNQSLADFWLKTVENCTHDEISLENVAPYIICKLAPFTTSALLRPVLGATTSSLDLQTAISEGKIVMVNLAKGIVGEGSARLVGALITMRLVAAAQTQMRVPYDERRTFTAYLDEFHTYATEHISEAIEETRKYKLRLVLACQSLGQVDGRHNRADVGHSIIANVANLIAFRLGVEDAHTLSRWFAPGFGVEDMLYLPNHTAVARLLANGQALRPIEFCSLPPPGTAAR